jgi:hypothetical protein
MEDGSKPIKGAYEFNDPGQSITLYRGPMRAIGEHEIQGEIELCCSPKLRLKWNVAPDQEELHGGNFFNLGDIDLKFKKSNVEHKISARKSSLAAGWLDSATLGSKTASLNRVVLHWMNLPAITAPELLSEKNGDGSTTWTCRYQVAAHGWNLKLDRRPDHKEVWKALGDQQKIAITHVMELSRSDGENFSPSEIKPVIDALQFGLSFALGRWVAPALPVGIDINGSWAWELWAPWHCDYGTSSGLAWWHFARSEDLAEFIPVIIAAFVDPERVDLARMLISMVIQGNGGGFVEQRIMTLFSSIEHMSWIARVLSDEMSARFYKEKYNGTTKRLCRLLKDANIPTAIDAEHYPAIAQLANDASEVYDGPSAVTYVRNRIVHPKARRDDIYHREGLLTDAWLLTRHYVTLLVLNWINYDGCYQEITSTGGWAGDVSPVPWSNLGDTKK